jgi:hypothetical protein
MDHCTVFGHGLLELVDFSDQSKYRVIVTETAVRANALLCLTPGLAPANLALLRTVLQWSGQGNLYDVRGTSWVVLDPLGSGPLPEGPSHLESWRAIMPEDNSLGEPIAFRIDPLAESLSARPPDLTITTAGTRTTGADPSRVGPPSW